ncbi:MAG: hypothetical protein WCI43_04240 [Candidatus Firestonebacteria bacterium]
MADEKKAGWGLFTKIVYVFACFSVFLAAAVNVYLLAFVLPHAGEALKLLGELPGFTKFVLGVSAETSKFPGITALIALVLTAVVIFALGKIRSGKLLIAASLLLEIILVLQLAALVYAVMLPGMNL